MFHRLVLPLLAAASARAAIYSSIPEDLHAFPKYRISFLNALPVSNETAQRWLRDGLAGGEAEFLDEPWPESQNAFKEISSAEPRDPPNAAPSTGLEHMRLGPSKSYLCLIPPAPTLGPSPPDDAATPPTPSHSWSLLQPLTGTCLYHRQGWFTYSYCHNVHVRQFRELAPQPPHQGPRTVEEDREWESYTLGKSPAAVQEPAANNEVALTNNLELAGQGAGQRYLVQRWSDGTMCDKTGRPREIEVQFHCSMTMMDTIMFVKETRTCEYILVVHTPRLCGEPGFRSRLEQMPAARLRCREILPAGVDAAAAADRSLPEARHPHSMSDHYGSMPHEKTATAMQEEGQQQPQDPPATTVSGRAQDTARLLRRAMERLLSRAKHRAASGGGNGNDYDNDYNDGDADGGDGDDVRIFELQQGDEDGEYLISFDVGRLARGDGDDDDYDELPLGHDVEGRGGDGLEEEDVGADGKIKGKKTVEELLRAAGYEFEGSKLVRVADDEGGEEGKGTGGEGTAGTGGGEGDDVSSHHQQQQQQQPPRRQQQSARKGRARKDEL